MVIIQYQYIGSIKHTPKIKIKKLIYIRDMPLSPASKNNLKYLI